MIPWLKRNSGILSGALLLTIALGAAVLLLRQRDAAAPGAVQIHVPATRPAGTASLAATRTRTATPVPTIMVQVDGAVQRHGVYSLPGGARLQDALAAAGGLTADADGSALNPVRILKDGERIVVPRLGEPGTPTPRGAATPVPARKVNLNTASAADLEALPGIGSALAQSIVAYRAAHGPFERIEDLEKISGIGPVLVARLRDLVVLR